MSKRKEITTADGEIITAPFLYTPHNYNKQQHSYENSVQCTAEEDRTQQQFKDECDINTIIKNYGVTGTVPQKQRTPLVGDYTEAINDYQTALNTVMQADEAFMELPSAVRQRFDHSPQKLLEFVSDRENEAEAIKLGLIPAKPAAAAVAVPGKDPAKPENKVETTT